MKKTFTISMSGKVFNIEEDALDKLQHYINILNSHYSKEEDGKEIISDIESRIAELFTEYQLQMYREVVIIEDIEKIINVMGKPVDIIDKEESCPPPSFKPSRKLYRNPNDRVLGGVASGIAAYFGIRSLWIRLIFIVLLFVYGFGVIVYLVLWCITPPAYTVNDKLRMKGESINIANIERSFKENYATISKSKFVKFLNKVFDYTVIFIKKIFRILVPIVGTIIIMAGIYAFLMFVTFIIFPDIFPFGDLLTDLGSSSQQIFLIISLTFLIMIPIIFFTYLGFRILSPIKSMGKIITISMIILWVVGLYLLTFVKMKEEFDRYNNRNVVHSSIYHSHTELDNTNNFILTNCD